MKENIQKPTHTVSKNPERRDFRSRTGLKDIGYVTPEKIFELIRSEPIEGARYARALCNGTRKRAYQDAAYGYALAQVLQDDEASRKEFYADSFFGGGYEKNIDHVLLHALQFLKQDRYGADSRTAADQAAAMQPAFSQGLSAEELLKQLIDGGGFKGLKASTSAASKATLSTPAASPASKPAPGHEKPRCRKTGAKSVQAEASPASRWWMEYLLVTTVPDKLTELTTNESQTGDRYHLEIVRGPLDENGLVTWRAITCEYQPKQIPRVSRGLTNRQSVLG